MLKFTGVGIILLFCYLSLPKFGRLPNKQELVRIKNSPNYRDGKFRNIENTPKFTGNLKIKDALWLFLHRSSATRPKLAIPSVKTDLSNLNKKEDILIWLGHSTCFLQVAGHTFLTDPVFSNNASPIPHSVVAFKGTTNYRVEDLPYIDYLLISHDHWDHLDYPTIKKLKPKLGKVICGLGVGAHFRRWGFKEEQIIELDWHEHLNLSSNCEIYAFPSRHFSGRTFKAGQSLWAAYLVVTPYFKFYVSGDSGYGAHYQIVSALFKDIDLAILDNGQYNAAWRHVHQNSVDLLQAARDLQAKNVLPVHHSKYTLAHHPWNEPLESTTDLGKQEHFKILTPMIGEKVELLNDQQAFTKWWKTES